MYATNWMKKPLEVLKRIKSSFISITGDQFSMSIR